MSSDLRCDMKGSVSSSHTFEFSSYCRYRDWQILDYSLDLFFVIMNCNFCYQYEMTVIEFVAFKTNPHQCFLHSIKS